MENDQTSVLRERAQGLAEHRSRIPLYVVPTLREAQELVDELRVHEIELGLQNEALQEAQREFESSRNKYRDLFEFSPLPLLHLAADSSVLDANRAALELFDVRLRELVGTRLSRFIATDSAGLFELHRREVRASFQDAVDCRLTLSIAERQRHVRLQSTRLRDAKSDWLLTIVDLTEQLELERTSREQAFLSAVLDVAGPIVITDARGHVVRMNRAGERLIDQPALAAGRYFHEFFAADHERRQVQRALLRVARNGRSRSWQSACPGPATQSRLVMWTASALHFEAGATQHVIVSGSDLSERMELQERLVRADRLAAVGTLAAAIGHEINNPLAYVRSSLELALRTLTDRAPLRSRHDELVELIHTAQEGIERIRSVVGDVCAFAGATSLALEGVNVHTLLDSCIQVANNEIRQRAGVVKDYGDVPCVTANQAGLSQVFLNLLVNAARAIAEGKPADNEISVRTRSTHDGRVLIEIEDTRWRFPFGDRVRALDESVGREPIEPGTASGFSVCHGIVASFGGELSVHHAGNRGSVVQITLPAAPTAVPSPTAGSVIPAVSPKASVNSLRILIVDDEPKIARALGVILAAHRVEVFTSPREALRVCGEEHFDLIFCDVLMPEMNGVAFHHALRELGTGQETRIVFMTGGAFTPQARDFLAKIPNPILAKPFTMAELNGLVGSCARRMSGA